MSRAAQGLLVIVLAASAAFLLLHAAPGDPFSNIDGGLRDPNVRATARAQLGLDRPLVEQYGRWVQRTARGDLGWSTSQERRVGEVLANTLPRTLALMSCAFLISLVGGVLLGAWQGTHAGTHRDRAWSALSLVLFSTPQFVLALLLALLLSPWPFPSSGMTTDASIASGWGEALYDRARHVVLPVLALGLVGIAYIARFERAAVRDIVALPFVRTARAKGLPESAVRWHAVRASLLPVITLAALLLPSLISGAVFVESVFSWPGMGQTLLSAIEGRDYDLVTAGVVLISALTTASTVAADLLRERLDPRTRTRSA